MDVVVPVSAPVPPPPSPPQPTPSIWQRFSGAGTAIGLAAVVLFLVVSNWPKAPVAPNPPTPPAPIIVVDPAAITVSAPAGQMTRLLLPSSVTLGSGVSLWWLNPPENQIQIFEYADHINICPQIAGSLDLAAVVYSKPARKWQRLTWIIDSGTGPQPPPSPDPIPIPDPTPDPKPKPDPVPPGPVDPVVKQVDKVAVVIVEDTSKRTPAQGKVIMDPAVRGKLASDGHRVIEFSTADPTYAAHGYDAWVQRAGGVPAVLVFDLAKVGQNSSPLVVFGLPDTAAKLDANIRKAVK